MTNNNYNISDINSFKDVDFYHTEGQFLTISNVICTFQEKRQYSFNVLAYHDLNATARDIEKQILYIALLTIGDRDENEGTRYEGMGTIETIVKLSSCTYHMDKYDPIRSEKIKEFTARQNGKWVFEPDRRCDVVEELCNKMEQLACEVIPFKEWLKSNNPPEIISLDELTEKDKEHILSGKKEIT